jgi:transcriptional regulator CtsR
MADRRDVIYVYSTPEIIKIARQKARKEFDSISSYINYLITVDCCEKELAQKYVREAKEWQRGDS